MSSDKSTLVVQSFRTVDVPPWINACMRSVREWAALRGFRYKFVGDELFTLVPGNLRAKISREVTIMSDLARLKLIRLYITVQGFSRVIWCDADVVICCPRLFLGDIRMPFALSREVWARRDDAGEVSFSERVNNSVCLFTRDSMKELAVLIDKSQSIIASAPEISSNLIIGTAMFTMLYRSHPFPLIYHTGMLSPCIMEALSHNDSDVIGKFVAKHGEPLYAANLCNYFRGRRISDNMFARVTSDLLNSEGGILNDANHR